jgi:hypothetical protein
MWLFRLRNLVRDLRALPFAPRKIALSPSERRRRRPQLERLEDRTLPSTFTAGTVADLIADIHAANQAGGNNAIVLAASTTFDLTAVNNTTNGANGLPVIAAKDNLAITGQGGDILQRDPAAPAFRVLDVAKGGSLTLDSLTLQNGLAFGSGSSAEGGAIFNQGSLSLNGVTVQNNTAQGSNGSGNGNGASSDGQDASGGGIWSSGALALASGTVVQSNQAVGGSGAYGTSEAGGAAFGGGLSISGGTANLTGVTVTNNRAQGGAGGSYFCGFFCTPHGGGPGGSAFGGGLAVAGGSASLTGDLLENNSAAGGSAGPDARLGSGFGGGLYLDGAATVTLCSDTVEFNAASAYFGGQAEGGGVHIAPKSTVYLDAFTVANTVNNTDGSGTNEGTANIDGSYILQNC